MFTGMELTPKGVDEMAKYVAAVREVLGMEVPLAADHFGHIGLNSCIRLGKALERYNLAWLEDMIPWQYGDLMKKITDSVDIPVLTGEDIYLKRISSSLPACTPWISFIPISRPPEDCSRPRRSATCARSTASPWPCTSRARLSATWPMCIARWATENFIALEHHSVDVPWWEDLVNGHKPLFDKGFATLPTAPGLGVTLNDAVVKQHLHAEFPGYFLPTPEWDKDRVHDRLWS
jgi:L-alanine-DL-glutamate epimerase-like enolase superfamily enzyme